jgi:hypothetical protein
MTIHPMLPPRPAPLPAADDPGVSKVRPISLTDSGNPKRAEMQMAEPISGPTHDHPPIVAALKFVSRLIRPTIVTGMMAALIATANTPAVVPLACGVTWTVVGHTIIFLPDCSHQSAPSPNGPPAGNHLPPQQEPPPPN